MKRYRIIGKSSHMQDIFLLNDKGVFKQHRIIRGKSIDVTENQLSFYTERMAIRKLISIVELEEEVPEVVVEEVPIVIEEVIPEVAGEIFITEETPAVAIDEIVSDKVVATTTPKKRRRRKKVAEKTED